MDPWEISVLKLTMVTVPTAVFRSQIVCIRRLVWLKGNIARAHYSLADIVDAVQKVVVVIMWEDIGFVVKDTGVDTTHHKLVMVSQCNMYMKDIAEGKRQGQGKHTRQCN